MASAALTVSPQIESEARLLAPPALSLDQRHEVVNLFVRGYSYRELADRFDVTQAVVYHTVHSELGQLDHAKRRLAERVVDAMLARLDICTKAAVALLERGEDGGEGLSPGDTIQAIHALVRVDERRASLLGANAPVRYEHSGSVGLSLEPEQVRRLSTAELEALQSAYGKLLEAEPETVAGEVVSSVAVDQPQRPIKSGKQRKRKA